MRWMSGLAVATTLMIAGCAGSTPGSTPAGEGAIGATGGPTAASQVPSPSASLASQEPSLAISPVQATGWTIATLPGAPFDMAGQRCGFADVVAMPAQGAIKAIEGTWELSGQSTMSGFPMTARITITAGAGEPALAAVPMDDEEVEEGPVAIGTADWAQVQEGTVNGVSLQSTGGGVGKWRYYRTGEVTFELKATKKVVVTVDGMQQSFPMQWPQWNLTNMTWTAQGCPA